jgi:hypothetical protein
MDFKTGYLKWEKIVFLVGIWILWWIFKKPDLQFFKNSKNHPALLSTHTQLVIWQCVLQKYNETIVTSLQKENWPLISQKTIQWLQHEKKEQLNIGDSKKYIKIAHLSQIP